MSDHDCLVGYNQDAINGFSEEFLDQFVSLVLAGAPREVLDLMGGDGSFSLRLLQKTNYDATVDLVDSSQALVAQAWQKLEGLNFHAVRADVFSFLSWCSFYDRIVVKSALHELPLVKQYRLVDACGKALKHDGKLFILDAICLDDRQARIYTDIIRMKDNLAELYDLLANRYIISKEELDSLILCANLQIVSKRPVDYKIDSELVETVYFRGDRELTRQWIDYQLDYEAELGSSLYHKANGHTVLTIPGMLITAERV